MRRYAVLQPVVAPLPHASLRNDREAAPAGAFCVWARGRLAGRGLDEFRPLQEGSDRWATEGQPATPGRRGSSWIEARIQWTDRRQQRGRGRLSTNPMLLDPMLLDLSGAISTGLESVVPTSDEEGPARG